MRILIAEDDFTSRTVLTGVLKKHGHEILATENGAAAWQAMQQHDAPRLAILDWMMPEIDGVEVCRLIRTLETDQPPYLIILTAKTEKADIIVGLDAGADDYLAKPFDPGELNARVNVGRRLLEMQAGLLKARNELAHEATHDPLTGMLNRRAILEAVSRELARAQRQQSRLAIGICDIDHFKKINDTYGHLVGDDVLCEFARLLKINLRPYDLLGRFGGEEFVVITPGIKESDLEIVYDRLRRAIADNPILTRAGSMSITVSIGATMWQEDQTEDELLAAADSAMYQAKRDGRNRVCLAERQRAEVE
jgi:diguanylate cyclase (GGDEF)-like protein